MTETPEDKRINAVYNNLVDDGTTSWITQVWRAMYRAGVADTEAKALSPDFESTVSYKAGRNTGFRQGQANERAAAEALVKVLEQIEHVLTPRSARQWAHEALVTYRKEAL